MAASPNGLSAVDIPAERRRLDLALDSLVKAGRVQLHWVQGQTWRSLQSELQRGPWHIFHFLGHGGYDQDAQESIIALADEQSDLAPLGATQIGRLLANQDTLRLVLLIACGDFEAADAQFTGIADVLIKRGLPAALVMQRAISTEAAPELTRSFYSALANGMSVDEALVEARVAISMVPSSGEWATPVLYSRAKGGALFELPVDQSSTPATSQAQGSVAPAEVAVPDPSSPHGQLLALAAQPAAGVPRPALRRAMAAAMALNDVKLLCDNLTQRIGQRVSVEDLGGETKEIIILNLIQFLDRRGLLQALLDELKSH